ncbi:MAG: hypothetical protein WBD79_22065, partial [Anaerolineae bacterium]
GGGGARTKITTTTNSASAITTAIVTPPSVNQNKNLRCAMLRGTYVVVRGDCRDSAPAEPVINPTGA